LYGIGQPILCFVLSAFFAYRAISLRDALYRRNGSVLGRLCQAIALAAACTTVNVFVLWALFAT
jgi:hypothetical protein